MTLLTEFNEILMYNLFCFEVYFTNLTNKVRVVWNIEFLNDVNVIFVWI